MKQITFPVGPLACNCSILADETSGEAWVIDPGDQVDDILRRLAEHRWTLRAIVITHAHIDHIGGAAALKAATGAPVWLNQNDLEIYRMVAMQAAWIGIPAPSTTTIDASLSAADAPQLGNIQFEVIESPGHTPGSVCLYVPAERKLFAGDTLFAGSIGRTDLPGGDTRKIMQSLHGKLMLLPDETTVIPGHGPETTIGRERRSNPFLQGRFG